jgi:uncharacterized protein
MPLSMYDASAPLLLHSLEAFDAILEKAEHDAADRGIDESVFLQTRLAPDMFPFVRQVQIATDMAKGGVARLAGIEAPRMEDNETSFDQLRARIRKTCDFIRGMPPVQLDGSEDRDIVLKAGKRTLEFKGQPYLLHFVLPNVFFHLAIAYGLLRHNGVELGKQDFLGQI